MITENKDRNIYCDYCKHDFKRKDGSFTDKVQGKYDLVLANIVADAIIFLSKVVADFMKDDAVYIMSGIIDTRAEEVKGKLLEAGLTILDERSSEGWFAFSCR